MNGDRITIFFDGVCGFCNRSVNLLLKLDRRRQFRFAPLQGETFKKVLAARPQLAEQDSIVVLFQPTTGPAEVFTRSTAATFALRRLGGFFGFLGFLLWLVPRPLRDLGYRLIATVRYRLFGKLDACRLPSPEERAVFLP